MNIVTKINIYYFYKNIKYDNNLHVENCNVFTYQLVIILNNFNFGASFCNF